MKIGTSKLIISSNVAVIINLKPRKISNSEIDKNFSLNF